MRFRVDLHVHTRRYSPCAEALDPEYLGPVMERKGLSGLVITEHDHLWSMEEIERLNRKLHNRRIYRGVEVSSCNGHFIVIGLDGMQGIEPGIGVEQLLARIRSSGAAIIWAHPHMQYGNVPAPLNSSAMPQGLHAVEVASGVTQGKTSAATRTMARRMGWAAVGGSDAHFPGQVGCAYTLLPNLPENEKHLAAAIRKGRCAARHRNVRK